MTEQLPHDPNREDTPTKYFDNDALSFRDEDAQDATDGDGQESDWESWDDNDRDALASAMEKLRAMLDGYGYRQTGDYHVFTSPESRQELFAIGKGIAEYVRNNDIGTVCFMDRSARPAYVALTEYWNKAYKGEDKPDIRFINPKGFVSREDVKAERVDLGKLMINDQYKQGEIESPNRLRSDFEIAADLRAEIAKSDKGDKPVLVFDACIHSGDSMYPVLDKLYIAGVDDVRVGTVSDFEMRAELPLDLQIMNGMPDLVCYPFGRDRMTKKVYGSIVAEPNDDSFDREDAVVIRQEIKKAIDEQWNLEQQ